MFIPSPLVVRRTLKLFLAGTRGGPVRLKILLLLEKGPHNINKISEKLALDYKTVQHHIRVLEKMNFIMSARKKYADEYKLSALLEANRSILDEIKRDLGKST